MNEELYSERLDMTRIPAHIAIIMDGNGRWAKAHGLERTEGHRMGVQRVRDIMSEATRLGVKYLTLYTFSTENWNRPQAEVDALMNLVATQLIDEIFMKNDVQFRLIGDITPLPPKVQQRLTECMQNTAQNQRMVLTTALNYSSRWEIARTMRETARQAMQGTLDPADINENYVSQHLQTHYMPDPDLLIRTGGELRISNFLLWQCAYSEFYFTDKLWPDFTEEDLRKAFLDYQHRQRRFGKTGEQVEQGL